MQIPPASLMPAPTLRPVSGCRGTDSIKNSDHFLKGVAFFEIRIWLLSESCRVPLRKASYLVPLVWRQEKGQVRVMPNDGQPEGPMLQLLFPKD